MNEYTYEFINGYNAVVSPSTIHVKNTGLARFFKRYLLQEAMSPFKWTLPENFEENYFKTVLYVWGYIGIVRTRKYGVIPQHGSIGGFTEQYQPAYMLIHNPLFRVRDPLIIGQDVALIRLQPDYMGIFDLVDFYGDLMALTAETAGVNILNSKLSYVFAADNKASAESMKKLYDNIASGEPAQFVDKNLFDDEGNLKMQMFVQDVGRSFIADKLLESLGTIRCQFLTAVGIPNANLDKKERMIVDEVNANNFETRANCVQWLEELKKGCKAASEMFGINISVDWRDELKGGEADGAAINPGSIPAEQTPV